jgi:hypothetical protein
LVTGGSSYITDRLFKYLRHTRGHSCAITPYFWCALLDNLQAAAGSKPCNPRHALGVPVTCAHPRGSEAPTEDRLNVSFGSLAC